MSFRRQFVALSAATLFSAAPTVAVAELPENLLKNAKAQFYNFLKEIITDTSAGLTQTQRLVINSTIVPMDLARDTPYYNQQLFRLYADRTFIGGVESVVPTPPLSSATRFSSQYRSLIEIASAQVDQNHPEIQNSLQELFKQQDEATTALKNKNIQIEGNGKNLQLQDI